MCKHKLMDAKNMLNYNDSSKGIIKWLSEILFYSSEIGKIIKFLSITRFEFITTTDKHLLLAKFNFPFKDI